MNGIVQQLWLYSAKGVPGTTVPEARFIAGRGMEGDYHAGGPINGTRQISLFSEEARQWMAAQTDQGLCFRRFRENITTNGIRMEDLKPGTRLRTGEAVLEITEESKHCHEECALFTGRTPCRLSGQSCFAKVIESGMIRAGDEISLTD
jgi:MOSC domain-containing protein YiiM